MLVMGEKLNIKHGKSGTQGFLSKHLNQRPKRRGILIKWAHKQAVFPSTQSCPSFSFIRAFLPC